MLLGIHTLQMINLCSSLVLEFHWHTTPERACSETLTNGGFFMICPDIHSEQISKLPSLYNTHYSNKLSSCRLLT